VPLLAARRRSFSADSALLATKFSANPDPQAVPGRKPEKRVISASSGTPASAHRLQFERVISPLPPEATAIWSRSLRISDDGWISTTVQVGAK
jgi:hypothetical protein